MMFLIFEPRQALAAEPLGECLQVAAADVGEPLRAELGQHVVLEVPPVLAAPRKACMGGRSG